LGSFEEFYSAFTKKLARIPANCGNPEDKKWLRNLSGRIADYLPTSIIGASKI